MLYRDESVEIVRLHVTGPGGEAIGGVEAMYVDEETDEREVALVGMGFFRLRHSFVPMAEARTEGEEISVPYEKAVVKRAPDIEPGNSLDPSELVALYRHYGIDPDARRATTAAPSAEARGEVADQRTATTAASDVAEPEPPAETRAGDDGDTGADARPARDLSPEGSPDAAGPDKELSPAAAEAEAPASRTSGAGDTLPSDDGARARDTDGVGGEDAQPLEERTVDELRQLAVERDIAGRSSMNKGDLVAALSDEGRSEDGKRADADYENRTVDELRRIAADRDIAGRSSMRKEELIDALRGR